MIFFCRDSAAAVPLYKIEVFMDTANYTQKKNLFDLLSKPFSFPTFRVAIYIIWQVIEGRKLLIVRLQRQIVNVSEFLPQSSNLIHWYTDEMFADLPLYFCSPLPPQEGKDKTFLLEKLQKLQNPDITDKKHKRPKEVCPSLLC